MRRLFLQGVLSDEVTVTGSDAHHLGYALRAKEGDRVIAADRDGKTAVMEITGFTSDTVTLKLIEEIEADTESPIALTLAMCLPKADKMEFIVQKSVELGVSAIQPIKSANCVVKYDEKKSEARREKWQRIANEAAKQCGRTLIPVVEPIRDIKEWLAERTEADGLFLCYENEEKLSLGTWLNEKNQKQYTALIGPEGGFSPDEAAAAKKAGAAVVTLGPRILRAETAALAVLSCVQYEKGDLGNRIQIER